MRRFGEDGTASEEDWGRWDGPPSAQSRRNQRRGGSGGGGSSGGRRRRTLEELVGSRAGESEDGEDGEDGEWYKQPRFKRVPALEAGELRDCASV